MRVLRCESLSLALTACATYKPFRCKRSVKSYAIRRYGAIKAKNSETAASVLHNTTTQEQPASAAYNKRWAASCANAWPDKEQNAATSNLYESGFI